MKTPTQIHDQMRQCLEDVVALWEGRQGARQSHEQLPQIVATLREDTEIRFSAPTSFTAARLLEQRMPKRTGLEPDARPVLTHDAAGNRLPVHAHDMMAEQFTPPFQAPPILTPGGHHFVTTDDRTPEPEPPGWSGPWPGSHPVASTSGSRVTIVPEPATMTGEQTHAVNDVPDRPERKKK